MDCLQCRVALGTIALIAGFVLLDVTVAILHGPAATISEILGQAGRRYPILASALALLLGHVFLGGSVYFRSAQAWAGSDLGLLVVVVASLILGAILWPN